MELSLLLNGTDLNGDNELDFGSCLPRSGPSAEYFLWSFVAQYTQYRGTSQGVYFDTETMELLMDNPAVQEALRLWKTAAGPPDFPDVEPIAQMLGLWSQGRCAMLLSSVYVVQNSLLNNVLTGTATFPGSEWVWSREDQEMVKCTRFRCPHATVYADGKVVNHAPYEVSTFGAAVNKGVSSAHQLAAYTFFNLDHEQ